MIRSIPLLILLFCLSWANIFAQNKVHVVTKTITRSFDADYNSVLDINGEKANIRILPSANKQIKIKVMLVSKNSRLDFAEEDIKYCDFKINKFVNRIEIANFFTDKPGFKPINSNLGARYEIEVPENTTLNICNVYGDIDIRNLNAIISINSSYGQLFVENISGQTKIISYYCDVTGDVLNSNMNITAQQAEILLKGVNNDCSVSNKYGTIDLVLAETKFTNLNGNMTKINLYVENFENHSILIEDFNGEIKVPGTYSKYLSMKDNTNKFIYSNGKSVIKAKTSYNTVNLNTR
jgi:hypothetical protein